MHLLDGEGTSHLYPCAQTTSKSYDGNNSHPNISWSQFRGVQESRKSPNTDLPQSARLRNQKGKTGPWGGSSVRHQHRNTSNMPGNGRACHRNEIHRQILLVYRIPQVCVGLSKNLFLSTTQNHSAANNIKVMPVNVAGNAVAGTRSKPRLDAAGSVEIVGESVGIMGESVGVVTKSFGSIVRGEGVVVSLQLQSTRKLSSSAAV